jgi:hypothetical protein
MDDGKCEMDDVDKSNRILGSQRCALRAFALCPLWLNMDDGKCEMDDVDKSSRIN